MKYILSFFLLMLLCFTGFSQEKAAQKYLLNNKKLAHSFIGICLYNTETGEVSYRHNAFRYFTPASTTKLYSFYAGLKYLQDSTTGIQYQIKNDTLYIRGTGDPTFLHPDFEDQPVFDFLKKSQLPIAIIDTKNENKIYGSGWAWDDYNGDYQPERTAFPIYGNVARFSMRGNTLTSVPSFFSAKGRLLRKYDIPAYGFKVKRNRLSNTFYYNISGPHTRKVQEVPFITSTSLLMTLLKDTLHKEVFYSKATLPESGWKEVKNESLDEMLKHMMHRSDNFYAEQTDAMVSMKLFHKIDTKKVIKYLLKKDYHIFPNKPKWVDGSGLSRYNLFSPADMVTVLTLLYRTFPSDRLYDLLPTGGKGTLKYFYRDMKGSIYAKTGSLSNNVALSGYLITQKRHTYIFSIMINHTMRPLNVGRHAMESFLRTIWREY